MLFCNDFFSSFSFSGLSAEEMCISIYLGLSVFDLELFLQSIIGENCLDFLLLGDLDDCCLEVVDCSSPPSKFSSKFCNLSVSMLETDESWSSFGGTINLSCSFAAIV